MRQAMERLRANAAAQGLHEVTSEIGRFVAGSGIRQGMLTVFCRQTSASLVIQENADPDVRADLETFFRRLVAEDPGL